MIPQSRKEFYVARITRQYAPEYGLVVGWSYDSSKEDVNPIVLTKAKGYERVIYQGEPRIWSSSDGEGGVLFFGEDLKELQAHVRDVWPEKGHFPV